MIEEFVLISPRGDTLVTKSYRGGFDETHTSEIFLRKINTENEKKPVFSEDGLIFCYLKLNGMYFVMTTRSNESPSLLLEMLERLSVIFKDYCGVLTEESIRKNFLLLYELLDEVFDHGYPQGMATEMLKTYVYNEPARVTDSSTSTLSIPKGLPSFLGEKKTIASSQANKPISMTDSKSKENVVFVDVIEKINMILDHTGSTLHCSINGAIQLKSFLTGCPEMKLSLNDDIVIRTMGIRGYGGGGGSSKSLPLTDANFHECVRWNEQSQDPSFTFYAPDGEFTLLSYRVNSQFRPPIICVPFLEEQGANGLDLVIRMRAEYPSDKTAGNVVTQLHIPAFAVSCSLETATALGSQGNAGKAEYDRNKRIVTWTLPKLPGNGEFLIRVKMILTPGIRAATIRLKQFGILNMSFELPMYLCSGVSIRTLDFTYNSGSNQPQKWIRQLTQSATYTIRF